jgi:O-antigen/teichoic acid export membrane protein
MVSWATTIASTGLIWADTLLLGHFRSSEDVGVYTVATRLVTLAVFVMAPINAAFAPQFAHHFHRGEREDMARIYTAATGWIVRLSLPAFALLLIFPEDLLALFGGEFKTGAAVTVTLAIGQLVNAFTGPCGTALNMAGHVSVNLVNNVLTLAFNVGLNLWLIPEYGAIGAALAWTLSLGAVNLARLVEVYLIMGLVPFDLGTLKALASFVVASLVALGVKAWLPPGYLALVVGGIGLAGAYLVTTLVLGLQPEEREVVAAFRTRTPRDA